MFVFLVMAALSTDSVRGARNDLLCNICVDIVTDIDSWITSDTTEDQIVDWLHMICEVATAILSMTLCTFTLDKHRRNLVN